ncbi:MAG: hypothetical protein P8Z68_00965 [Kineosporiaceae bacterium]
MDVTSPDVLPRSEPVGHLEPETLTPDEVADPPETGDPEVDAALQRLSRAVLAPLPDQVAGYEAMHRALQDRLADAED